MRILYFAALREKLKLSGEEIPITADISVLNLRQLLLSKHQEKAFADAALCAVNQELATDETLISNDDEVAFYPAVTGG